MTPFFNRQKIPNTKMLDIGSLRNTRNDIQSPKQILGLPYVPQLGSELIRLIASVFEQYCNGSPKSITKRKSNGYRGTNPKGFMHFL